MGCRIATRMIPRTAVLIRVTWHNTSASRLAFSNRLLPSSLPRITVPPELMPKQMVVNKSRRVVATEDAATISLFKCPSMME